MAFRLMRSALAALATLAVCVPQALAWTMLADCSDVAVTDVAVINDGLLVASPKKVFNLMGWR